jgi:hypothetical protein
VSILNDILDAIVTDHTTNALTVGGNSLTIVKRKMPKRHETVDQPYQVTISGAENVDLTTRISFDHWFKVQYNIEMTLITPSEGDTAKNLADHAQWRESVRARYMAQTPLSSVTAIQQIDVLPSPLLPRRLLVDGYDYNQILLRITTYEDRG